MPRRNVVTSEQVVSAAADLVAAVGPQGLHLSRVAEVCGVAVGTLYNHFPSKEHLLAAVSARAEDLVVAAMAEAAPDDRPLLPALPAVSGALLDVACGSALVRVLLRSVSSTATEAMTEGPRIKSWIAARVIVAQSDGEIGPADAELVAHLAYGLVRAGLPVAGPAYSPGQVQDLLTRGLLGLLPRPVSEPG